MAENRDDDSPPGKGPVGSESTQDESEEPEESSAQRARRTTSELTVSTFEFFGPLPPPQLLKGYNDAFAGCAERVVAMAERQSEHRQKLETIVIESNCKAQSRGQWFAFVLALMVIGGGVYLLAQGKSVQGFSAIIIALASLIGALVYSHTEQKKERERRLRPFLKLPVPAVPIRIQIRGILPALLRVFLVRDCYDLRPLLRIRLETAAVAMEAGGHGTRPGHQECDGG